ncbi:MAG: hypothetical protein ACRDMH_01410 [Solirubrobacterales bacterium]
MGQVSDQEIRQILETAADPEPGSWLVGLTVVLRSSEEIEGTVKLLEDDEVLMHTDAGERRARIEEIENVIMHFQSQGPE